MRRPSFAYLRIRYGSAGVVELRALERDDPHVGERDQPRRLLVRAAPEPDEVGRRAARLIVRVVRALGVVPLADQQQHQLRHPLRDRPQQRPVGAVTEMPERDRDDRRRRIGRRERVGGERDQQRLAALPRERRRRARRTRRCSPTRAGWRPGAGRRAARAGAAWRRRRPRSGPSASTRARRPGGARSARARADTGAGGRSRSRAARRGASAAGPGWRRGRRRPTAVAAGRRRRTSAPAPRRRPRARSAGPRPGRAG